VLNQGLAATSHSPQLAMDLALLYERNGRFDDAISTYEAMLTRNLGDYGAVNNLAMLLSLIEVIGRVWIVPYRWRSDLPGQSTLRCSTPMAGYSTSRDAMTRHWLFLGRRSQRLQLPRNFVTIWQWAQLKAGNREDAASNLELAVSGGADYPGIEEAKAALTSM